MLVITRKEFQYVMINDNVKITVERINRGEVRLSFDAPLSEKIWRGELYERRRREAQIATRLAGNGNEIHSGTKNGAKP